MSGAAADGADVDDEDWRWLRDTQAATSPLLTLDHAIDPHGLYRETPSGLYVPASPRSRRTLRVADLFCGCGGFSLGMQQAGLNVVAALEWEPNAIGTYLGNLGSREGCAVAYVDEADRKRHQKVMKKLGDSKSSGWIGRHNPRRDGSGCRAMVVGDAAKVSGEMIRETLRAIGEDTTIDVVVGGPPCQGMSSAGKQRPDDPRNNLVLEFVRIADELGADIFVMENVPPLITQRKYQPLFDELVGRANRAGFTVTANVLDAANYGVPQRRRRAFVVGTRGELAERPFSFAMPTNWSFVARPNGERVTFLDGEPESDTDPARRDDGQLDMFGGGG